MHAQLTDSGWRDQAGNSLPVSEDRNLTISFGAFGTTRDVWAERQAELDRRIAEREGAK